MLDMTRRAQVRCAKGTMPQSAPYIAVQVKPYNDDVCKTWDADLTRAERDGSGTTSDWDEGTVDEEAELQRIWPAIRQVLQVSALQVPAYGRSSCPSAGPSVRHARGELRPHCPAIRYALCCWRGCGWRTRDVVTDK